MRARWKRCVDQVDSQLSDALGQKFVDKTLGEEGKRRTLQMVDAIEKAMGEDIQKLDWMTPKTKEQALIKLHAVTNKIGTKAHWIDYSTDKDRARRRIWKRGAHQRVRVAAAARQDRQAGGQDRMADEPAAR